MNQPIRYRLWDDAPVEGASRILSHQGRQGLHLTSVHARASVAPHTLNTEAGALTLWLFPLEDLSTYTPLVHLDQHEPTHNIYTLLSDNPNLRDWPAANFALVWCAHWNPQLWAKFFHGALYPTAVEPTPHAVAIGCHFQFHRHHWYQVGLTWDVAKSDYRIYFNGLLVGTSNRFATLKRHPAGERLYFGNTCFAFADLACYDTTLDDAQMQQRYRQEATRPDPAIDAELRRVYAGDNPQPFAWMPTRDWQLQLESSLRQPADLDLFHVQGNTCAPRITSEGLLIHTPMQCVEPYDPAHDHDQVYLWTRHSFEGDLALEFEFMPQQHNGLSALLLQANGMQREDFMAEYPLRPTGSVNMVYTENVRNYHWEFFREMHDARNDVACSALFKHPWQRFLAYSCLARPLAQNQWHRLQFVQDGPRLRGALDGELVFDVDDTPGGNTGGFYQCGHVAIRCMTKTRNLYRNLRVFNRPPPWRAEPLTSK